MGMHVLRKSAPRRAVTAFDAGAARFRAANRFRTGQRQKRVAKAARSEKKKFEALPPRQQDEVTRAGRIRRLMQ